MPLLDEDTAFSLADRLSILPPERRNPNEVKSLFEYKQHQQELGLPLFPSQEAKAREMNTQYRNIFTDIKKVDEFAPSMAQIAATSPDPDKTRQMFANHAFLAKELDKPMEEVQANYNEWMGGYSQQVWGKRVADTAGFYGMAQGHVRKQIEAEEVSGEAMRLALTSAAMGTNDSVGDYQKWKASTAGKAPTVDAHRQYSAAYNQVKARIEPYKPIVAGAVKSLKQLMAGEGATAGTEQRIVDAIIDLPPQDRPLVLASIMAGAQATGEGADKDWTFWQQTGESFSRLLKGSFAGQSSAMMDATIGAVRGGFQADETFLPAQPITTPEAAREFVQNSLLKTMQESQTPAEMQSVKPDASLVKRQPTPEEKRMLNSELNRVQRQTQIAREIENAAVTVDPVKNVFASAIGSSLAILPASAMGPGGVLIAAQAYSGMEYDKLRVQYPTMSPRAAQSIAGVSGVVMAGLDKLEVDFLTDKLPSLRNLIGGGVMNSVLKRMGVRAAEAFVFENVQEGLQDLSTPVVQEIATRLNDDIPELDWNKEWAQWTEGRGDVALGTLPLVLIGVGAAAYNDVSNAADMMKQDNLLQQFGLPEQDRVTVIDLANKGDMEGAQAALRDAYLRRDPAIAAAAIKDTPAAQAAQQFDTNLTRSLAPRYTQEGDNHVLTFPDGRVIKAESWSEARWYMEQAMGDTLNQEISTVAELGNFFTSQQREGMTETLDVIPEQRTIQQDVAEGVITEEQARERAAIAGEAFGLTPEEAQEEAWTVLGRNTTDTQNDVAQSAIQLFEGADVSTVVEEVVEGRLKAALAQNKYSAEQVKKFIAQVESATGEKFMVNDTEQGITEAISAIVVADVLGRRKDGTQLPAGLVTRGMLAAVQRQSTPKANRKLMGMVAAFRSFFRQVFSRAKALNKAKGEGKLGAEYQGFVDELLGVDPQVRELNVAAVEARSMVGTATGETQVEETQQTPMEQQAASSLELGAIVRYNGYVGRLEQDGQRFVVRAPDQEVELSGEDLVEVVLERDPATTRELFVKELGAIEVNLVEGKFTPASSGLAIISPTGVRLVPQNRTLSKNVVQTPNGVAFRLLDPTKGKITLVTGQQAQQAMDAMLEAAANVESMGRKVSYSLGRATPQDTEYLAAVESGDMETAQRMVDEAAIYDNTPRQNSSTGIPRGVIEPELRKLFASYIKAQRGISYDYASSGRSIRQSSPQQTAATTRARKKLVDRYRELHPEDDMGIGIMNQEIAFNEAVRDPVVYDEQGNVIPLSQRFNPQDNRITYALAPAKFSEQVMTELEQQLGKDPAQRWAYGVEIQRRLAKLSTEVDQMAAADLTSKERKDQQEQFVREKFDELVAQMPPNQPVEELGKVMAQAKKEGDAWAAQNKADAPGQRERIIGYQRIVNAALMGLPKNLRTDIGGFLQVADARSATTALKAIKKHIARIGETVERYLKEEIQTEVKALIKRGKPNMKAGEKPSSDIGAEASNLFAVAAAAIKMDEVQTLAAIDSRESEILNAKNPPTPEREQQLRMEIEVINLAGDLDNADAAQSKALLDTLQNIYDGGYLVWLDKLNREKAKIDKLKDLFKAGTGLTSPQEVEAAMAKMRARGKGQAWIDTVLLELGSFNDLIYRLAGENSEFAKELLKMERKSDNMVHDLNDAMEKDVGDFFTRLAGSELAGQQLRAAMSLNTKKGMLWLGVNKMGQPPVKHTIKVPGKPDAVEFTSQMEAIHDLMMWRQPDGRRNMSGKFDTMGDRTSTWGYDDAWAQEVSAQLTPESWALMDWLTEKYQQEGRTIDPLVRDRYGVMLPQNPLYSPLTNSPQQVQAGQMTNPITGAAINGSMGITPGSLKARNKSVNKPRKRDALRVFMAHSRQMNHWIANYDFARTMQQLFLNREMLDYVEAMGGEAASKLLLARVDMAVVGGMRDAGVQLAIDGALKDAAGRAAASAILGRISTLAVQSTQLFAGSLKMPQATFLRLFGKLSSGQLNWDATRKSDFIQRRIAQKSPLVQEAMKGLLNATSPSLIKNQQRRLAELLAGSDAYFTAATHTMIYHHQLEVAQGLGMGKAEAEAYAMDEADRQTEEVAQPVRQSQRSLLELRNSQTWAGRVGWAFASEARQKLAIMLVAAEKVAKDPSWNNIGELARVANYMFTINGLLVQVWKRSWLLARTPGGDEEEFDWKNILLSSLAAPMSGTPGWQAIADTGNLFSSVPRAEGPVKRMVSAILGEDQPYDGDPVKFMRDAELLLGALSLVSDTATTLSAYSHVFTDLAKLIDAQIQD